MPASRGARSATIWDQWKAMKLYHAGVVAKGNFRGSQGRDRPGRRVRDLLGHNSLATVQRYVPLAPEHLRSAVAVLVIAAGFAGAGGGS